MDGVEENINYLKKIQDKYISVIRAKSVQIFVDLAEARKKVENGDGDAYLEVILKTKEKLIEIKNIAAKALKIIEQVK